MRIEIRNTTPTLNDDGNPATEVPVLLAQVRNVPAPVSPPVTIRPDQKLEIHLTSASEVVLTIQRLSAAEDVGP